MEKINKDDKKKLRKYRNQAEDMFNEMRNMLDEYPESLMLEEAVNSACCVMDYLQQELDR